MLDPLTPDHQTEYRQTLDLIGWFFDHFGPQPRPDLAQRYVDFLANSQILAPNSANIAFSDNSNIDFPDIDFVDYSDKGDSDLPDNRIKGISDNSSVTNARLSDNGRPAYSDNGEFEEFGQLKSLRIRSLNASQLLDFLLRLLEIPHEYPTTPPQTGDHQPLGLTWLPVGVGGDWSWSILSQSLRIPQQVQKQISQRGASAISLVSHLLHAFSPQGKGIRVPWRLCDQPSASRSPHGFWASP